MNALANRTKSINWSTVVMFVLGFWLSASLMLDSVIIPILSSSGMMEEASFPTVGYSIFGVFNHIELLCAAIVLSGFLVFSQNHFLNLVQERLALVLAAILLTITLAYTYILTPQMSGLGLQLNLFDFQGVMCNKMISLHEVYWFLEVIKFVAGISLLRMCYRNSCTLN
jgi:hypothetical protein